MELYWGALLVCSLSPFVAAASAVEELRNKTEEVEIELKQYESANLQLVQELKDQDTQAKKELGKLSQIDETVQSKITAEAAKLNELREALKAEYAKEASAASEIEEEESLFASYLLRIDLITQDIALLEGRRKTGQVDKCKSQLALRQLSKSRDELNEEAVLKVSLQRLTTILNYAKARNVQLNEELENKVSLNNRMKIALQTKLVDSANDLATYKNVTRYFQERIDEIKTASQNVTTKLESLKAGNEEQKVDVTKLEEKLKEYQEDINCYKELAQKAFKVPVSKTCADASGPSPLLC